MAGTATVTENVYGSREHGTVKKIKFDWGSDTTETVSQVTSYTYNGAILFVATVPDGGGTAPTTLYDVALNNSDGIDVLGGKAANRSATATEYLNYGSGLGAVADGPLTLTVAAAGENKGGLVYILIG